MNITLENDDLQVQVKSKGAELCSIIKKDNGLQYMWSGDPAVWGKTSPILFPIVGTLKDDKYVYNSKSYTLSRHGFARDAEFEIVKQQIDETVFLLKDSPGSLKNYPFSFELFVHYTLDKDVLKVHYEVKNIGADNMYFSLGAHPAFKVPLTDGSTYGDYFLEFDSIENSNRWPINKDGLIKQTSEPFFESDSHIPLSHKLFAKDALVFKDIRSHKISLKTNLHNHGLDFYFEAFPFLGLWAAKEGDFICIEPWCGIADSADSDQLLINKEGIQTLPANKSWNREWKVRMY